MLEVEIFNPGKKRVARIQQATYKNSSRKQSYKNRKYNQGKIMNDNFNAIWHHRSTHLIPSIQFKTKDMVVMPPKDFEIIERCGVVRYRYLPESEVEFTIISATATAEE